ncbi:MAG: cation-translocating P-type ATPase [Nitrosomonadales bacterium]|nr:cation-translocating P-type ATPase [Nitrosomonadales bacterium]
MKPADSDRTAPRGLSLVESRARLRKDGGNELPVADPRNVQAIALEVLREPMFLLLVSAGAIYLLLGDVGDALMLLGFVFVVMGITIYQELKTERVLEALRDLTSPRALVLREGIEQRIAGREVVRGDLLILTEGDRVAADAVLISCNDFTADESLLTGESAAVRKLAKADGADQPDSLPPPGGDDLPYIYSGTLVVQGRGMAQVLATGPHTEIGKIGRALQAQTIETTPLQKEIGQLVRRLAIIGVLLSLLLLTLYGLLRGDWLHGLLSGITLAMSILPEEYPVILAVFMAMGAWRISKHRVLTRRVPTVEALGSATVLCVDKTGTLTQNRMAVQQLVVGAASHAISDTPLPEAFHQLVEFAILSSETAPFDPMEKALHAVGVTHLTNTEHLHGDWKLAHEYSLSPDLLALSHVWKAHDRAEFVVATKGAPEAVADLCHFDAAQQANLAEQVNALAAQGMRVLGVARANWSGEDWPEYQHDFDFEFLGLVGLADPVRPTVSSALKECATAGIRVVMITGDYPATALAIAGQIGLEVGSGGVISGAELSQMDDAMLRERIRLSNIYARMVPEQKLRLVNALKDGGEIVAMTGDGVNDAPALKAAHIGIAMGARGTDVAREAAALVLLDDDFASIVHAVRIGRGIFDNLRKAMAYIFAVHLPIAGLALIPLLLGWPPVFAPVHIVFLEMIINPACSIAFEAEPAERGLMHRPPRDPRHPLFSRRILILSLLQGLSVLIAALAVQGYSLSLGASETEARAMSFTTLVIGNLSLILVNRSWQHSLLRSLRTPNPALWWVTGGAFSFLLLSLNLPFLRNVFHFASLTPQQLLLCLAAGLGSVLWFELYKLLRSKKAHPRAD